MTMQLKIVVESKVLNAARTEGNVMTRTRHVARCFWLLPLLCTALGAPAVSAAPAAPPGIPNFHAVGPGITRGAAPTPEGLRALKAAGVQTVVDLRISPRLVRQEAAEARALGLRFVNLPMGSDPPTPRQVSVFLATLKAAPQHPVFVHCQHGADRTGCMIGIYRETQQGWDFPRTWAEMRRYGFNPHWALLTQAVRSRVGGTPRSASSLLR